MNLTQFTLPPNLTVLLVTFLAVFFAELVGDKSLFTIAALGLKFRAQPVFAGFTLAFMGKMLAAVLFGRVFLRAPQHWISLLSATGFFVCAVIIWFRESPSDSVSGPRDRRWIPAATIAFSSLFFTE